MYGWICHWRVSVSVTDPHNRLLVTGCLQWSSKVLGPLWITNSGLHFKQMSPMLFTEHYKHQKWMWKWNNQHVTSVGQRKTLSPRQDSNLWPPKHRAGALSTWATQPSRLKFLLGHHLATNSFGLGHILFKVCSSSDVWHKIKHVWSTTWRLSIVRWPYLM